MQCLVFLSNTASCKDTRKGRKYFCWKIQSCKDSVPGPRVLDYAKLIRIGIREVHLVILFLILYRIKKHIWPNVPDPSKSNIAQWSPQVPAKVILALSIFIFLIHKVSNELTEGVFSLLKHRFLGKGENWILSFMTV